jgi:hypothetical protein
VNPGRKTLSFAQWPLACYSTGKQGASLKVHHYRDAYCGTIGSSRHLRKLCQL